MKSTMRIVLAAATVTLFATSAFADAIADRKALMKAVGGATKTASDIMKGDVKWSPEKGKEVFAAYTNAAAKFGDLFPAGSEKGGETTAAPAIWSDNAGFKASLATFKAAADGNAAKAASSEAEFKAAFGAVVQTCKGCHEKYRVSN
jgi:cytochrome c556